MTEASSCGLEELRALLAAYGPVQVLEAFSVLCNEAATLEGAPAEGVELWECAARAAHEAALSLTGEDGDEEDDESEGGEELGDAEAHDDGEELADDAPDDDETTDEPSEATAASPAEDMRADDGATADQTDEDTTTMAKDSRLGPRPAGATTWRCKRADGKRRTGTALLWEQGGVAVEEWPIRVCTADTILERWGPGSYVLQYIHEEAGKRRPCGTSRVLHISGRKDGAAAVATDIAAPAASSAAMQTAPSSAPAVMPAVQGTFIPQAPTMGGDFANVFALMTFLNEQNERARAAAAQEAKIAMERYRADQDMQLERERIASQERIALAQAQNALQVKTARAAGPLDPDALAAKIGEAVGLKLQEQRDEEDEYEDTPAAPAPAPAPPPPPPPVDPISKLIDALAPVIPLVVTHFQNQAAAAAAAARAEVVDHAAE